MWKTRILAVAVLILGVSVGYFVYGSEARLGGGKVPMSETLSKFPFRFGLDLSGGAHLVYRANVSKVDSGKVDDAMASLRDVIERRVNLFGVSEPVVQRESGGFANAGEERLIVDLPGVTDVNKAISMIGQTPLLEFRTESATPPAVTVDEEGNAVIDPNTAFVATELTGQYLDHAALEFDQNTGSPVISLVFTNEGGKLFEKITRENIGKMVAIYLDGAPISTPVVQEAITDGKAQISGSFTAAEARTLVGRLNSGALPVPIELVSTQTIGATLGEKAISAGAFAGIVGFLVIALFLILWYRLPGIIAVISLAMYVTIMLTIFKIGVSTGLLIFFFLWFLLGIGVSRWFFALMPVTYIIFAVIPGALAPVTLTVAGIAGFIISIGIAVDANVLIFERIKEEIRGGRTVGDAVKTGFARAWLSIRDSNISTLITAAILFAFSTSLIQGFALVLGMGILVSLFSAISISRLFLSALNINKSNRLTRFLFSSGFSK